MLCCDTPQPCGYVIEVVMHSLLDVVGDLIESTTKWLEQ